MRPWAMWCVNHNLKFVLYLLCVVISPAYVISTIRWGEAFSDLRRDIRDIRLQKKELK